MKFRMFELAGGAARGAKVAVNVDEVAFVEERDGAVLIVFKRAVEKFFETDGLIVETGDGEPEETITGDGGIFVADDFHTVISRLNTVAE